MIATIDGSSIEVSEALVRKYDVPLPRYTSYPPADRWGGFEGPRHAAAISGCGALAEAVSLYFHLPFCDSRCSFCGCSTVATKNPSIKKRYVEALLAEIRLVAEAADGNLSVVGVHFGGGTPASVGIPALCRVMEEVSARFSLSPGAEVAIELDPRLAGPEEITRLARVGFTRMSFGVQDFDSSVGKMIGRESDFEEVKESVLAARREGVGGVNADLVYGLPGQTGNSWERTLEQVALLCFDRIALFNFAYLPARLPHQRAIESSSLPGPTQKLSFFVKAIERLESAGFAFIGLDHFARAEDRLAIAHGEGKLTRNFQGYTAEAGVPILGLGATAISELGPVYSQNEKKLASYLGRIESGSFATCRGALLSKEDELRRAAIRSILCRQRAEVIFEDAIPRLRPLEEDGMLRMEGKDVFVTPLGRLFPRHAAAAFDAGLGVGPSPYSRAV